jgi:hypothetical protein
MSNKKILIVSATRGKTTGNTLLSKSLETISSQNPVVKKQFITRFHSDNSKPLPQVYNQYINNKTLKQHQIVLFVHDDVYIDDLGCFDKLNTSINTYKNDIVGLAGTTRATIKEPALWHLMSDKKYHTGAVAHFNNTGDLISTTSFGPYPMRCLLLDGLFMAVNIERAVQTGWKFNEEFEFHHYDLASCLDANKLKMRLSTCNIHVVHQSPGLSDYHDKSFQQSQSKFIELYGQQ